MTDPTRSPPGTETAWAYTHVPRRPRGDAAGELDADDEWGEKQTELFADRMEQRIEQYAPGFRRRVLARHVFTPRTLEQANENLVGGAVMGGTASIHQQLVFRPTPGLARPDTPVRGLYLASASAHPGGGVHGGPGANAAKAALAAFRRQQFVAGIGRAVNSAAAAATGAASGSGRYARRLLDRP